jgi:predicted RNase H-like HicB family nuclease
MNMEYLAIIEKGKDNFSAYVPDLPGCIATAETEEQLKKLIKETIEFHIEGLKEEGLRIPRPSVKSFSVKVA